MTYFIPLEINFLANIYLLSKLGNSRLRGEEYGNILTTALSCQGDCIGRRHIKHGGVLQELVYGGDRQVDGDGGGTSVHDRDDVFYWFTYSQSSKFDHLLLRMDNFNLQFSTDK